jgi:predicted SprT family Zn-dependent metalloprotease
MDLDRAEKLVVELADLHHVNVTNDWTLAWHDDTSAVGMTDYWDRTISFSRPLIEINDESVLRETTLHEFAHVKVGFDPDDEDGHGPEWQAMAYALGATVSVPLGGMPPGSVKFVPGSKEWHLDQFMRMVAPEQFEHSYA